MTTPPKSPATWFLDGRSGVHECAGGRCRLDLDRPATGIALESAAADRLLGLELGRLRGAADHWLRAGDIAAVYEPEDARRLRATAMWRLHDCPPAHDGIACELILSAQTSILESDSGLAVVTEFAEGRLFHGRPAARQAPAAQEIVWHEADDAGPAADPSAVTVPADATALLVHRGPPQGPGSIGTVAVHPADVREIGIERRDGRLRITCWLFTGSLEQALEKGVLLRGRVFAAVEPVPAGGVAPAFERAASAVGRFNASPPPLTT
jgi:hypothetical protein